jgi:hypothetical protein
MATNFTLQQLKALDDAIALGAREVMYGDKKAIYKNLDEMLTTRNLMRNELGLNGNEPRGRRFGSFDKGIR